MFKVLLLLSAIVAGAFARPGSKLKCPMVPGKYPFDETRIVGQWNVLFSTVFQQQGHKCTKFNYRITPDHHVIDVSSVDKNGQPTKGELIAEPMFGKEKPSGNFFVVYRKENGTTSPVMKDTIVATDYENYAMTIGCQINFNEASKTFDKHVKASILSRNDKISSDTLSVLKNLISGFDIDPESLVQASFLCP